MYTALRNTKNKGVYLKKDFKKEWRVPGASIRDFQDNELEKALSWTKTKKIKTVKPEKNVNTKNNTKTTKNVKVEKTTESIKTTVTLPHNEYEFMLRVLEEEGIKTMGNIEVAEVIDILNEHISYIEEEDSWTEDLDWNTQMFLHCQGAIDLCGSPSRVSTERSLLNKFKPLWRRNTDVFVDIVLRR